MSRDRSLPNYADDPKPSVRQKMIEFADLYRGGPDDIRGNATACYQIVSPRASVATARKKGQEYLAHRIVQERLAERTEQIAADADVTQERVLKEIARIGLFDPRKLFDNVGNPLPIQELSEDVAAAIAGLKVTQIGGKDGDEGVGAVIEYKLANKNDALEKLMKFLGAYEKDNKQKNESLAEALMAGIQRLQDGSA